MNIKKVLVTVVLLIMACTSIFLVFRDSAGPESFPIDTNSDSRPEYMLSFRGPSSLTWEKVADKTTTYKYMNERVVTLDLKDDDENIGEVVLTLRQVDNKDAIYFLKYTPTKDYENIRAVVTAVNIAARSGREAAVRIKGHQLVYENNNITNRSSHWEDFDLLKTLGGKLPKNAVFLDSKSHYLRLGLVDIFKPLKNSVRQEMFEESPQIAVMKSETDIDFVIPLTVDKGNFLEQWGILSNSPLIDWDKPGAVDDSKAGDLVRYRKLSPEGIYYLTPWNYYPTEKTAFWLNPGSNLHVAGLFSRQDAGDYFKCIMISSMYSVIETQGPENYWPTTPRSDWLYQEYGIPAGFYDTRFNTDVAEFVLDMYKKTGEEMALKTAQKYATFLREYVIKEGIVTSNNGILVPDYHKPDVPHKKTLASLNHMLAEMNFLYGLYLEDKNSDNLKIANMIRQGLRDTGKNWIMPNSDLHYAYLGDGSYGRPDYPLLTLNDLRRAQTLIEKVSEDKQPDDILQSLIEAKQKYLINNNLPIR